MMKKTLITLTAVTALAISSAAMARGGGGGGGGGRGGAGVGHFHGHFGNHFRFANRFLRNQALFNAWDGGGEVGVGPIATAGTATRQS